MVGLDLTHQALATPEVRGDRRRRHRTGQFVGELLDFFPRPTRTRRASTTRRSTTRAPSPT